MCIGSAHALGRVIFSELEDDVHDFGLRKEGSVQGRPFSDGSVRDRPLAAKTNERGMSWTDPSQKGLSWTDPSQMGPSWTGPSHMGTSRTYDPQVGLSRTDSTLVVEFVWQKHSDTIEITHSIFQAT